MATLPKVGAACFIGLATAADAANNRGHEAPYGAAVALASTLSAAAALASTIACIFPSYVVVPTPQGSETTDKPPVMTNRCIIPIQGSELSVEATVNETDCVALATGLAMNEAEPDPMALNTFRVFGETVGISPENRLVWQGELSSANQFPFDLSIQNLLGSPAPNDPPQPAMWGIDAKGEPFLVLKCRHVDTAGKINQCIITYFRSWIGSPFLKVISNPGILVTTSTPYSCRLGPLNTFETYDQGRSIAYSPYNGFTNNLKALLEGKEVKTSEEATLVLASSEPTDSASPASAAEMPVAERSEPDKV